MSWHRRSHQRHGPAPHNQGGRRGATASARSTGLYYTIRTPQREDTSHVPAAWLFHLRRTEKRSSQHPGRIGRLGAGAAQLSAARTCLGTSCCKKLKKHQPSTARTACKPETKLEKNHQNLKLLAFHNLRQFHGFSDLTHDFFF